MSKTQAPVQPAWLQVITPQGGFIHGSGRCPTASRPIHRVDCKDSVRPRLAVIMGRQRRASRPSTQRQPALQRAGERISHDSQDLPWAGECQDVVADRVIITVPLDGESLLALLSVLAQGAVGEAVAPPIGSVVFHHIDNPAGIQRPEPEMAHHDGHIGSGAYGRIGPEQPQPRDVEHLPCLNRVHRSVPHDAALAKPNASMVYVVVAGQAAGRRAHL